MKKKVYGYQLGRTKNQRRALFGGLVRSLFEKGRVVTTIVKAKAIIGEAEKLITKAKKGTLADRRLICRFLNNRTLVDRLVDGIAPMLRERKSGYLRIVRIGARRGDRAELAQIEFVDDLSRIVPKPKKATAEGEQDDKTHKEV